MGRQFGDKVILESLGTKPQVQDTHAGGEKSSKTKQTKNSYLKKKKKI